ncbi:MAG: PAS domain S-box protein, partial [Candidatus Methanoperedens sp.]|nr:PAS domain S-box protein [Candidatus Methanoperedens sp.]
QRGLSASRRELEIEATIKEQYAKRLEKMVEERTKEIKKLSDAVRASTDSIVISDPDAKITDVNEAALKMYGTDDQTDLVGKSTFDLFAPEDREKAAAGMKEAMEKGYIRNREYQVVIKDGSKIPVEMSASLMKGTDGEPIGFVGISRDITERKKAEEALERLRRQNELILNSAGEGILGLDLQGRHTFVNPSAARMFGYEVEELIGKSSHEIWHHSRSDGSPYPKEECPIYAAYKDGAVYRVRDEVFWRKDGASFPVGYTSTPILKDGKIVGTVVTFSDITERKQAEETLKKLSSAIEQGADSVIITDKDDVVDYVNPAFEKLTGYTREEVIGKKPNILKSGKHDKKFYETLYETIHSGRVYRGEIINKKKNGEIYLVASTITPITDMQGNITHFVSTEKDITERKKAEEQLKASLKEKEILLGEIHHRVKNNIQVISSMLSLQSEYITEDKYRDMFQESQNRILSMSLIHEKLYQSMDFAKIDLNEYINDLVNDLFQYYGVNT